MYYFIFLSQRDIISNVIINDIKIESNNNHLSIINSNKNNKNTI